LPAEELITNLFHPSAIYCKSYIDFEIENIPQIMETLDSETVSYAKVLNDGLKFLRQFNN